MFYIKRILTVSLFITLIVFIFQSCGVDDKSKRPSPPDVATDTIAGGNVVTINYSRPSLKARRIGRDVAVYDSVWRTGDNEATTFEIAKDAKVQGKHLPKGKYSLYTLPGKKTWTIIFNNTWDQWGAEYNKADDVLRVQTTPTAAPDYVERMKFIVEKNGSVLLFWGDIVVPFQVN